MTTQPNMESLMLERAAQVALAAAATTTTYSWLAQATSVAEFVVMCITAVGALLAAWYYYERARATRKERTNEDSTSR